jgi:hypothetical protein
MPATSLDCERVLTDESRAAAFASVALAAKRVLYFSSKFH